MAARKSGLVGKAASMIGGAARARSGGAGRKPAATTGRRRTSTPAAGGSGVSRAVSAARGLLRR